LYRKLFCHTVTLLLLITSARGQNYIFAQLKGSPMNTTGWNLQGAAAVTNVIYTGDSELLICPARNGTSGAIFYNQPINLSVCSQWKAEFDYRIYDGTGADGLAFCFLDVPPVGFVLGAGLGIPKTANGLKVCFDTYNNCNANTKYEVPKVELRWGSGYDECASMPTATNQGGYLNFVRSSSYVHAVVAYDNGNISVTLDGKQVLTGYQQFNFSGYLGFTSSTGGQNDNQSIKNVVIYTQMPPSEAGVSANPVCPGDTVKLGTTNNASYSYSWTPSSGLSSTTTSNPYAVVSNTTGKVLYQKYFVKTSFASNSGCASQDSVVIQVNPSPLTDFAVPVICLPNSSATINNKTVINDGTQSQVQYTWTFSDGGTSTQTSPVHNYPLTGNYTIALLAVSNNGCKNEVKKSFTVNPQAKVTIAAPAEFCQDTALIFKGNTAAGLTIQKWNWNFGDNTTDVVQNPAHTYAAAKAYTVTLSAVTTEGCNSDTPSAIIIVNPLPVAKYTVAGLSCEGQSLLFTDASQASAGTISSRSWNFDDGTTANTQTVNHSFAQYGSHTVSLTVQNSKGCNSQVYTQKIVVNPLPVAAFSTPFVCTGVNGTFTNTSTIADGTQSKFTYQWYFGDGTTGTASQPVHAYQAAGSYTAKMVLTSGNGCTDSASEKVTISAYPKVDFKILTTDFCGNLPLQLQDNSSVAYATLDKMIIYWNTPATSDSTPVAAPVQGTTYTHNYPTFGYINSQQVNVKIRAYSSAGCYSETSASSILFASPKLEFGAIPTYCENSTTPVLLNEAKDTSAFTGTGSYSGDGVSNGYFTPSAAGAGQHTITYTYTLVNGCKDTVQQVATVAVQPTVSAGQSTIILQGGQIVLQGAASGGSNFTYLWTPAATLNDATLLQPIAKPANDTYYTLLATNDNGCSDTAGVLIKVLLAPIVPNAFSPNGDAINDTWQIAYLSSYPDCIVEVFNRYGQIVFRNKGYATPWNGTYNGSLLPVGTYYYIISTSHLPKPLSGPLTILR
jgi:gliding motility-associated-like protein